MFSPTSQGKRKSSKTEKQGLRAFGITAITFLVVAGVVITVERQLPSSQASHFPPNLFEARVEVAEVSTVPLDVAIADINGDSLGDLVASSCCTDKIHTFFGNGNGTFADGASYAVGGSPDNVAVGDLDGDTDIDVATANFSAANISVLLNNGSGVFGTAATYANGETTANGIVMDYFNADNALDIVVANGGGTGSVSVHLNNGDGTFAATATTYATGGIPRKPATGDFNGDTFIDIAAPISTGSIAILLGVGDGTFGAATLYAAGTSPAQVTAGDFDGDLDLDLAAANDLSSGTVSVLLNTGGGVFAAPVSYSASQFPASIAHGQFVGDASLDLAVLNSGDNQLSIFEGNGDGTFATHLQYEIGNSGDDLAVGFVDSDSNQDIATATAGSSDLSVFLGSSDGPIAAKVYGGPNNFFQRIKTADLDGDGLLDIAGARYSPNQLITYINDGTGAFPTVTDTEALAASPADLALGNVDTDSDVDAAIPHGASSLSVLLNNGSGVFGTPTDYTVGGSPAAAVMADLDGDTDTDIAVANLGSSNVSILLNNGLGTFTVAGPYAAGASPTSIEAGNLDGDGDIDLVVGDGVGDVTVLINNGSGVFAADPAYPTGGNIEDVVLGLINDDAVLDVVATDTSAEAVYVRFGNGDGTLGSAVMYPMLYFNNAQETALGDYDGDGDIDLATTNASTASSTLVQLNNGSGVFVDPVYYGTGLLGETITSGDFNGDGAIDLAAASGIQDAFMILLNAYSAPEVIVTESGGTTVVTEGGATDSYTVHLASEPHATVTVTATPDAQETVSPSMLTFTTLNYATPQTVTVTAVDDGPGEGQHTGLITHSVASTDLRFDGIAVDSVVPTILEVAAAGPSGVQRISGESPRDLAIQASKETFAAGAADSATLAREDIIVDALTVTPLSNLLHATLLLTSSGGLADEVAAELDRALGGPDSGKPIYLTGGTEALTPQVVTDLEALGYSNIVRLDGQNRRRTAKRVAEEIVTQNPTPTSTAYIAEDSFFADSLGLGAIAASLSNDTVDPILLVERGKPVLEPAAREFLEARPEIVQVELVGGPVAIDLEVEQALKELLPVRATTRHAGADRYATNANLLEAKLSDPQGIVVANGAQSNLPGAEAGSVAAASAGQTNFFSALLAGRFAADQDLGLALTRAAGLPDPIVEWFARHESTLTFAFILGDFSAVSAEVEASILSYL